MFLWEYWTFLWFPPTSQRWQSFSDIFNDMKRACFSLTNKTSVGFYTVAWISFDIAVRPFYGAGDRSVAGFEHIGQEIGHRMDISHHITICHHHHLYHTTILRRKSPIFLHPKTAIFSDFGCKKMGLGMPKSKNGDHFLSPTIPKNGGIDSCFTRISFSGEFWANFENRVF